jgi:hypothetical protein
MRVEAKGQQNLEVSLKGPSLTPKAMGTSYGWMEDSFLNIFCIQSLPN